MKSILDWNWLLIAVPAALFLITLILFFMRWNSRVTSEAFLVADDCDDDPAPFPREVLEEQP